MYGCVTLCKIVNPQGLVIDTGGEGWILQLFLSMCASQRLQDPKLTSDIAPFNNMQTLNFNTQLTITFFTAINHNFINSQQTVEKNRD